MSCMSTLRLSGSYTVLFTPSLSPCLGLQLRCPLHQLCRRRAKAFCPPSHRASTATMSRMKSVSFVIHLGFRPRATQMLRSSTICLITLIAKPRWRCAWPSSSVLKLRATVCCFRTNTFLRSRKDFRNTERPCNRLRPRPAVFSLVL